MRRWKVSKAVREEIYANHRNMFLTRTLIFPGNLIVRRKCRSQIALCRSQHHRVSTDWIIKIFSSSLVACNWDGKKKTLRRTFSVSLERRNDKVFFIRPLQRFFAVVVVVGKAAMMVPRWQIWVVLFTNNEKVFVLT